MLKNYNDVTKEWIKTATPNSHNIENQLYYEYKNKKYIIDGKNVVLDYSYQELEVAKWLRQNFGGQIKMIPRVNNPEGIQTPDYIFRGEKWDLKEISGNAKRTIDGAIKKKKKQANNFILDITNTDITIMEVKKQLMVLYKTSGREWVDTIIVKKNNDLILVFQRKKRFTPAPARQDKSLCN